MDGWIYFLHFNVEISLLFIIYNTHTHTYFWMDFFFNKIHHSNTKQNVDSERKREREINTTKEKKMSRQLDMRFD